MTKTLIFVQDGVGGAERMSVLIGRELYARSNDVCFCLMKSQVHSSITDFIPKMIRKKYVPGKNGLQCLFAIAKILFFERPTYVFSSVYNLNTKLLLMSFLFPKTKFIIRCDNYLYTYTSRQRKLLAYTYHKADIIVGQTEEMKEELVEQIGIDSTKVLVLHNPIDTKTIDEKIVNSTNPYPGNGKKHIVAVGRFNPQKGFDMLADAFLKLREKVTDVDLYIVGDFTMSEGRIKKEIFEKFEKEGLCDDLHCVGYKDNPYPYIRWADSFVLSSRWEGLPNVLLESLYLGTPVASFKCIPIIERIVDEGVTGFLAEKGNVDELAIAMIDSLKLGRVVSSYKSASIDDFIELFQS